MIEKFSLFDLKNRFQPYVSRSYKRNVMQNNVILKSRSVYVVLCLTLGWAGAHHFYLKRNTFGIIYLLSFGLFGIGWLYDLFRVDSLVLDYELNFRG